MNALVVSLHDVSPWTRPACEAILATLGDLGIRTCSLLVIPNHHHRGHFLQDPDFCQWLRGLSQDGHEIVLHGYYHQRPRRETESMTAQITTRFYTADEGEFYDLEEAPARDRVGRENLRFPHQIVQRGDRAHLPPEILYSVLPRRGGDLSKSNLADVRETGIDESAAGLRRPNRHWCLMPDQ